MKIRLVLLIISTLLLFSCGDGIDKSFHANGNDNSWSLTITKDREVHFNMKGMQKEITFSIEGEKYMEFLHSHKENGVFLEFNILDRECHNYIREKQDTKQVIIRVNDVKYLGCGEFRE